MWINSADNSNWFTAAQHTYATSFGIPNEAAEELARKMPSQFIFFF